MKFLIFIITAVFLIGCSDSPRRQLSSTERAADMAWVFSKFDHNYAPAQYKEDLHSFDYESLKAEYLEKAKSDQSNEEFHRLVAQFVAQFKDAHTSVSLNLSPLPGRARIAYLGFGGVRKGDNFVVTRLFPTIYSPHFPIKIGDEIIAVDGISLKEKVDTELVPYLDLGNVEANYTGLMGGLFAKDLNRFAEPQASDIVLSIKKGEKINEVKLPWIVKDRAEFSFEQAEAERLRAASQEDAVSVLEDYAPFVSTGIISFSKLVDIFSQKEKRENILDQILTYNSKLTYFDSFEYFAHHDILKQLSLLEAFYGETPKTQLEVLQEKRALPDPFEYINASSNYPAAVMARKNAETKKIERVGYIWLSSFSAGNETEAVNEFKKTLKSFHDFGIKHLIIDMIDNGGGSLSLGSKLAQTLSNQRIELPKMQFKLNDNWLDSFENQSLAKGTSDSEREIARRVLDNMLIDMSEGKKISRSFDLEELFPFSMNANIELATDDSSKKSPFKTLVLVNEMCASMCDIFAGMLQDNNLAEIFGQQSMGAGGNVTTHGQAPNSGFILQQTESLVVRSNGEYLENNGVKPNKVYNTFDDIKTKYAATIMAGVDYLLSAE